jgi:DNA-binding XRE family transcriptional regulator
LNPVPRLPGEALPDLPTWSQLYELYKTSGLEQLLKLEIEDAFHDFCQFAREHSVSLILPPVEWAKTHAWLLIEQKLQPKAWAIEALGLQPDQPGIEQPLNRFAREVISFWQLHIHMMAHEAEVERAKNSKATVQATTSPVETSPLAVALPSDKMSIANNIEKLRKECGWGADSLADKTRLAKTTVLSHLKGRAKPQLQTLVKYAQAFSKALGRHITASDLEK